MFHFPILPGGSTMFDQLYIRPAALARHRSGPLFEERLAFLKHLADQGYPPKGLRKQARRLLVIARFLRLASRPRKTVSLTEIKRKTVKRKDPYLYGLAVRWLQFTGRLQQRPTPLTACAKTIKAFADYMEHETELAPTTIATHCWFVTRLLRSAACERRESARHYSSSDRHRITEVARTRRLCAGRAPSQHVFLNRRGQPLTRFGIHALVERYAARVVTKVPSLAKKRVSPHTIRHTTATHLLRAGVDINTIGAWLGHVCLSTTNVYAEVDLDMKAKALVKCEIKGGKPKKP